MTTENRPAVSRDAQVMMAFESRKKSTGAAYLLWFFFGVFGGHRFYLGYTGSAVVMLILGLTFFGLIITAVWALIDAFLIPGMIVKKNEELRQVLTM